MSVDKQAMELAQQTNMIAGALERNLPPEVTFVLLLSYPVGEGATVTFAGNVAVEHIAELLESVARGIRSRAGAPH